MMIDKFRKVDKPCPFCGHKKLKIKTKKCTICGKVNKGFKKIISKTKNKKVIFVPVR